MIQRSRYLDKPSQGWKVVDALTRVRSADAKEKAESTFAGFSPTAAERTYMSRRCDKKNSDLYQNIGCIVNLYRRENLASPDTKTPPTGGVLGSQRLDRFDQAFIRAGALRKSWSRCMRDKRRVCGPFVSL